MPISMLFKFRLIIFIKIIFFQEKTTAMLESLYTIKTDAFKSSRSLILLPKMAFGNGPRPLTKQKLLWSLWPPRLPGLTDLWGRFYLAFIGRQLFFICLFCFHHWETCWSIGLSKICGLEAETRLMWTSQNTCQASCSCGQWRWSVYWSRDSEGCREMAWSICKNDARRSIGTAGYYRCYIDNFVTIAKPLTKLTTKLEGPNFHRGPDEAEAFESSKASW